jgi:HEAT repeat protein
MLLRISLIVTALLGSQIGLFAQESSELALLLSDLKSGGAVKKRQAASAIGALGKSARSAAPTLVGLLEKDRDSLVRRNVAESLGEIGGDPKIVVPALSKALKDSDPDVMAASAMALGKIGKPALGALRKALSDSDHLVRKNAANALTKIGPEAREAVPDLITAFKAESPAGRRRDNSYKASFAEALGAIGPDAKAAVTPLEESIAERGVDREFRRVVNEALRKIKK